MERDSFPGPTAEEAGVHVSCQALYSVVRLGCGERRPVRCLLGLARTQLGSGDFFRSASSAVLSVGLRKFTRQALRRAVRAGEDGCWKVFYCLGDVTSVLPPCCPRSIVPRFVIIQDLDVSPNSRCQRRCLRILVSVLPPEEVCPDGLVSCLLIWPLPLCPRVQPRSKPTCQTGSSLTGWCEEVTCL